MNAEFLQAVDERSASARASGDLLPIQAEETVLEDAGLRFIVRWVSSLAVKDAAKVTLPGGPRDPDFNPFLAPEPALTVGPVGEHHVAILNKFPVCDRHLVLARRTFEEQLIPLAPIDFAALARVMGEYGGLGFYNGGAPAGARRGRASATSTSSGFRRRRAMRRCGCWRTGCRRRSPSTVSRAIRRYRCSTASVMQHCFVRVRNATGTSVEVAAHSMHTAFGLACRGLALTPDVNGLLPSFNLLTGDGWLMLVPRSREHFDEVSINALSYGGTLYVRRPEQVEAIRATGPLRVLAAVGC